MLQLFFHKILRAEMDNRTRLVGEPNNEGCGFCACPRFSQSGHKGFWEQRAVSRQDFLVQCKSSENAGRWPLTSAADLQVALSTNRLALSDDLADCFSRCDGVMSAVHDGPGNTGFTGD